MPRRRFFDPALTSCCGPVVLPRHVPVTVETNVVWGIQSMISAVSIVIAMAAGVTLGNYLMQYLLQRFAVPRNVSAEAADVAHPWFSRSPDAGCYKGSLFHSGIKSLFM